jgi:hypothetical protein
MNRTYTLASLALAGFLGAAVVGCDSTTSEHKTVDKAPDGTTVTHKETVKQDDSSTTVKKSTDVDRPGLDKDGDHSKTKTTVETK